MEFLVPYFLGFITCAGIFLRWVVKITLEARREQERQERIDALTGQKKSGGD